MSEHKACTERETRRADRNQDVILETQRRENDARDRQRWAEAQLETALTIIRRHVSIQHLLRMHEQRAINLPPDQWELLKSIAER